MSVYEEILSSSNILNVLNYYGLDVNKNKCMCPFHNDTHPSMMVNTNKGIAKCFACGSGGNSISFIKKYETEINHNPISTVQAMQKAIDIQHLNIEIPQNNNKNLTKEDIEKMQLSNILKDAIAHIQNNLKKNNVDSKNVLEYLKNRNLSPEIINEFHIGYDPNYNNITNELLNKYNLNDLISIGITKDIGNGYKDVFSDRIVIPIFDENGNPVGFGARTTTNTLKPKYLNTKETELFNKSKILFNYHKAKFYARDDEIIIVEGYMDVISAKTIGFDNVVGTMGTALTKEHVEMIKKLNCEVTLCLDNDEAGKNAMLRTIPELLKENIEVNVLDISKLENKYKDFGDLLVANLKKEDIYKTKISAFIFLLENKYLVDKELNVDNISKVYKQMVKDNFIKDTKDVQRFKEYIIKKTNLKDEEIENIIMPKEINKKTRVDKYKDLFFYSYITNILGNYAIKKSDRILQKYIEAGKLTQSLLEESLNNENYLLDNENTINIVKYVEDYIYNSEDFNKFRNDKSIILENLLERVKSFDSQGNIVNIQLDSSQKDMILKQYEESFESNIREYIENNPDEFEELFIANNAMQFEKLFPKTYVETLKEQAISRFKSENVMEAVRYCLAYPDNLKSVMNRQYVNNDKYKTLLVFNNNKNILNLTQENIIQKDIEKQNEKIVEDKQEGKNIEEKKEVQGPKENKKMSVFIKLSGKEKESYKGIYLPVDNNSQIFIPKQLYKKDNDKLRILSGNSRNANMSEYVVNTEQMTKKWVKRLSIEEFYHKYFKLYEISTVEKEVMPSASY